MLFSPNGLINQSQRKITNNYKNLIASANQNTNSNIQGYGYGHGGASISLDPSSLADKIPL